MGNRAVEILGLQQQTAIEVTEAAHGRRLLRIAASSAFAEHAAPGLIDPSRRVPTICPLS